MQMSVLVGAAALLLLGAGCTKQNTSSVPSTAPAPKTEAAAPEASQKYTIRVKDQASGKEAMMDMIAASRNGFLVVHEDNDGKVGAIAGTSALVRAGESSRVPVPMTVHPGLSHWVMFHVDDGDGVFNAEKDAPAKDADGDVMMKSFRGMGEAMEKAAEKMMQ
jgi:glucose/arabinose dehydrogenase